MGLLWTAGGVGVVLLYRLLKGIQGWGDERKSGVEKVFAEEYMRVKGV